MKTKLSRLVRRVQDTRAEEISCSECLDLVSQYVDIELSRQDAETVLPAVKQHLGQCLVCAEEYQILRDLAALEAANQAPDTAELKKQLGKD